jgi:hypothetical protein
VNSIRAKAYDPATEPKELFAPKLLHRAYWQLEMLQGPELILRLDCRQRFTSM